MKKTFSYLFVTAAISFGSCTKSPAPVVTPDFSSKTMDLSVKPQDDFYLYANGNWMKNNPLPDDKSRFGCFDKLREDGVEKIQTIIDEVTAKTFPKGSLEQRIGDFYKSGMDVEAIETLDYTPIVSYMEKIEALQSKEDLAKIEILRHQYQLGSLFHFFAGADYKNSKMNIANVYQGGLGLADNSYYTSDDPKNIEKIQKYTEHISKMFQLMDISDSQADQMAKGIVEIETELAKVSLDKLKRRNPNLNYHFVPVEDLKKMTPNFNWDEFFAGLNVKFDKINVSQPGFFKGLSKIIKKFPLSQWKDYLKWGILDNTSSYLSKAFVDQNFEFFGKYIQGTPKDRPRWKKIVGQVNGNLGELMGQLYVKKYFPPQAKIEMQQLVENLRKAFEVRIKNLTWMSEATKKEALAKLHSFGVKVGYPDKWREYKGLEIDAKNYFGNILLAKKLDAQFNYRKINKPVDAHEWGMNAQTVNAYYHPLNNEIVFPAAILQPPFFYLGADKAVNYGAIGVVIGHEMTHGFDDKGSMFDKDGNLKMWWTEEDRAKFDERTQVLVDQFDAIEVLDGMHANGKYTLGENIADNGGLKISMDAYRMATKGENVQPIDGFDPIQRFLLSYARVWATNIRDKEIERLTNEDVHSLGENRVNAQVVHMPEFYKAFDVKEKDKMFVAKEKRTDIW